MMVTATKRHDVCLEFESGTIIILSQLDYEELLNAFIGEVKR